MEDFVDYIAPRAENINLRELKETLIWVSDDGRTAKPVFPEEFKAMVKRETACEI